MQRKPKNQFERRSLKIEARNRQIFKEFKEMYDTKRRRYDDCVVQLADKWFLSNESIEKIIKKELRNEVKDSKLE